MAVDVDGNAYVTDSLWPQVWRVTPDGKASVFATDSRWWLEPGVPVGLNGIEFVKEGANGYLIVGKSGYGKALACMRSCGFARRHVCIAGGGLERRTGSSGSGAVDERNVRSCDREFVVLLSCHSCVRALPM